MMDDVLVKQQLLIEKEFEKRFGSGQFKWGKEADSEPLKYKKWDNEWHGTR